jgi:glycosyltransferase involved in cell wall biosynthesis
MSDRKILTILIPVYNGERFLGGLLQSFASYSKCGAAGREFLESCEILVVNNRSEDATLEIARSFEQRLANLRVITPDTHVPSAEENVFRALGWANGEYTWVLGCDDIVCFDSFPDVLQVARDGKYDIAVFNPMQSDQNGRVESACTYYMEGRVYEGDLVSLTQRVGFWWLIAGFSGQIIRTAAVAGYDHPGLVAKTSPIYSHVTAYLECLAGRPAAIFNIQNVIYRLTDNDVDHWRRAAANLSVFDEFFWTLGYIRQIKYLERRGIVRPDYLVKMLESNRDGFFRPTNVIYDKLLNQLRIMRVSHDDDRNRLARSEFVELVDFLGDRDLLARPFLAACQTIFDALSAGDEIDDSAFSDAHWRLQCYQSSYLLAANCVGAEGSYEIYCCGGRFYAVHRLFRGALVERIRCLDRVEEPPVVFEAENRAAIRARIAEAGIGMAYDSVPESLMRYCSQAINPGSHAWHSPRPMRPEVAPALPAGSLLNGFDSALSELRATYRTDRSFVARGAAWLASRHVKLLRWLLKTRRKRPISGPTCTARVRAA